LRAVALLWVLPALPFQLHSMGVVPAALPAVAESRAAATKSDVHLTLGC